MLRDKLTKEEIAFWHKVVNYTDTYFLYSNFILEDVENLERYLQRYINENIRVYHGVSKAAIVLKDETKMPVVMKVGFDGQTYDYDDDYDDYVEDVTYRKFHYADGTDDSNYANAEYEIYQNLKKYNLHSFFAEIELFRETESRKYFLQESCIAFDDKEIRCLKKTKTIVKEQSNNLKTLMSIDWLGTVFEKYGEEGLNKLEECYDYDYQLFEDMHAGNYGYRSIDNSPVIFDYSKWYD